MLIQREGEGWHEDLPRQSRIADGLLRMVSSTPVGHGVRSVHVEYLFPDAQWTQTFLARPLTTKAFEHALAEAGLVVSAYLTDDRTWVRAAPVTGRQQRPLASGATTHRADQDLAMNPRGPSP